MADRMVRLCLVADAGDIMAATPYWDLGFPAQLKTYIENILCPRHCQRLQQPRAARAALCRARSLTYITTTQAALVRPAVSASIIGRYGKKKYFVSARPAVS